MVNSEKKSLISANCQKTICTLVLSRFYTHAHKTLYTSHQTIAKQTIKTQITSSSKPCPRPPCLLENKKFSVFLTSLDPSRKYVGHTFSSIDTDLGLCININDLITLYYCYNSEAFSGIESERVRAHTHHNILSPYEPCSTMNHNSQVPSYTRHI